MPAVLEVTFRKASVHLVHDLKCLDEGADLNDALLDFFVKLGQALVPENGLDLSRPPVAFLGSHFYDVLCKGGSTDGKAGHANVANWCRRRLGPGGLFQENVGALAVAVNETLRDEKGEDMGKHWWLALMLNMGPPNTADETTNAVFCLDSYTREERTYGTPPRAVIAGAPDNDAHALEVQTLSRAGCHVLIKYKARGSEPKWPLAHPRESILIVSGQDFCRPDVELLPPDGRGPSSLSGPDGTDDFQHHISSELHDGYLHFELDSESLTSGEHVLEYGGPGVYREPLVMSLKRRMSSFQRKVAGFLRGYLQVEWCQSQGNKNVKDDYKPPVDAKLLDVPQQENANDCGYFLLEQILLVLQLSPQTLRLLAGASVEDLTSFPWPSQADVTFRKEKLKEGLGVLFQAAKMTGTSDVEVMMRRDPDLLEALRCTLVDSTGFVDAVRSWEEAQHPGDRGTIENAAKRQRTSEEGGREVHASGAVSDARDANSSPQDQPSDNPDSAKT